MYSAVAVFSATSSFKNSPLSLIRFTIKPGRQTGSYRASRGGDIEAAKKAKTGKRVPEGQEAKIGQERAETCSPLAGLSSLLGPDLLKVL
jgi:hypothetical protein